MSTLTAVRSCSVSACAYNNGGCAAPAITVGGSGDTATCTTLITLDARGGLPVADGHVGACQRLECVHNSDLMCTATAIAISGDTANCASYKVAK